MKKIILVVFFTFTLLFASLWPSNNKTSSISFNAVTSAPNGDAKDDWDQNLTTQIVNKKFKLYILSEDNEGNTLGNVNVTKVTFMFFNDGNNTDCNGSNEENQTLCDDNNNNDCNDTNSSGESEIDATIKRAAKCIQVHIEGKK